MIVAYFDCFSGASGDMILGALLDAGLDLDTLQQALHSLPLPRWRLTAEPVLRGAIGGTLVRVLSEEPDPPSRHLADVLRIIDAASLPGDAAAQARAIFTRLAESEARVHRRSIEQIHFHEVGAADAIVDICGAVAGLALLGVQQVYCSPLPLSSGSVESAHGTLPLPAPATVALLAQAGAPTVPHSARKELLTPTGAAILTTLARFERPPMRLQGVGYGAGSRSEPAPNLLRVMIGEAPPSPGSGTDETLALLECNIDDMNPQWYGYLFELLLQHGALDVTCTPVLMKKGRPGQVLSVLCRPDATEVLTAVLLSETTSLGVRCHDVRRRAAERAMLWVETPYGQVPVKLRIMHGIVTQATPEYDECKVLACVAKVPLAMVSLAAQAAAHVVIGNPPPNDA